MPNISHVVKIMGVAMLVGVAMPVFAESAPVYDADTMQQQFENSFKEASQELPPPPPPGGQEGTFVPVQTQSQPVQTIAEAQNNNAPSFPPSVEQRMLRVEQRIDNLQNQDSASRVETLQSEVQSLRGQVEQLTHQLNKVETQQKSMYADVDKRLTQQPAVAPVATNKRLAAATQTTAPESIVADDATINSDDIIAAPSVTTTTNTKTKSKSTSPAAKPAPTPDSETASTAKAAEQPNVAEEQQIYQTAYNLIKAKKYNDAVNTLQKMLQKYPSGQFASNAHYWLGELYGLMSKHDQALNEFSTVVKSYPTSPRVSDAQLKVGLIYASQSKWSDAKGAFKKVINRYPGSASARLASEQLKQIKQAGH